MQRRNQGHFLAFVLSLWTMALQEETCMGAPGAEGIWHQPSWSDSSRSSPAIIISLKKQLSPLMLGTEPKSGAAGQAVYPWDKSPAPLIILQGLLLSRFLSLFSNPEHLMLLLLVFMLKPTSSSDFCVSFCTSPKVYIVTGVSAEEDVSVEEDIHL